MRDYLDPLRTTESFFMRIPVIVVTSVMITHAVYAKKKRDQVSQTCETVIIQYFSFENVENER